MFKENSYTRTSVITFRKTAEAYGGLSNMCAGYPLRVNNLSILTSEALYQACRFPHLPELQKKIILQKSPMSAKMVGKPFRNTDTRKDWDQVRVDIMAWCLKLKLAQNYDKFKFVLLSTKDLDIVEDSHKDPFWGAIGEDVLVGVNALGKLLQELREEVKNRSKHDLLTVQPLQLDNFLLDGKPIGVITCFC